VCTPVVLKKHSCNVTCVVDLRVPVKIRGTLSVKAVRGVEVHTLTQHVVMCVLCAVRAQLVEGVRVRALCVTVRASRLKNTCAVCGCAHSVAQIYQLGH
jgi:hypothetical protein